LEFGIFLDQLFLSTNNNNNNKFSTRGRVLLLNKANLEISRINFGEAIFWLMADLQKRLERIAPHVIVKDCWMI